MRNVVVLPPVKSEFHAALMNLTAFKKISTHDLIAMARALPGGTKVYIPDRLTAIVLLLGTGCGPRLGKNFPADHVGRANFPFVVTDADVLDDRIATIINRVRGDDFSRTGERGIDLSDHFSPVVANLHFRPP